MVALSPRQAQRIADCLLRADAAERLAVLRAIDPPMVDYLISLAGALQSQALALALLARLGSDHHGGP